MQEKDKVAIMLDELGDVAKLGVKLHPHPETILHSILKDAAKMFTPDDTEQAVDYCKEFVAGAAKYGAWILRDHAKDHPEKAIECCPHILEVMVELYKMEIREAFDHLCKWDEFDNPFLAVEPTTNEKTMQDILAQIEAEHL